MKILFVHQNFPGQFKYIAEILASDPENQVMAFTMNEYEGKDKLSVVKYKPSKATSQDVHSWAADIETKIIRGEAAYYAANRIKSEGFYPEVILAHPGWGESLFLKEVWPNCKLIIYCEFYYAAHGLDVGFDPEFSGSRINAAKIRAKNFNSLLHFDIADGGISPTIWQKNTFPEPFRSKITVIHDGIDTNLLYPNQHSSLTLRVDNDDPLVISKGDEVVTFVNRNLEPYRGYHIFMRSLPRLLAHRPNLKVLIVGGDGVSYGHPPDLSYHKAGNWKEVFAKQVRPELTDLQWQRIIFLGNLPYDKYIALLQVSMIHVYLTYPFILGWSLLEAMSVGCAIVASNTGPLQEVIENDKSGILVDFFDYEKLAKVINRLIDDPIKRESLGKNAREVVMSGYDLKKNCLPKLINLIRMQVTH